jgi:hypothetical protein
MMWIAWRRLRSILVGGALAVAIIIAIAVWTGRTAQHLARQYYGAPCHGGGWSTANSTFCNRVSQQYFSLQGGQGNYLLVVIVVTLVIASVIGAATVAAEFDRGTVRWAWTQSRSRRRWWSESSAVALLGTAVLIIPVAVTMSWWEGAVHYQTRFDSQVFLADGWILVAYAMLATSLTLILGLFVRHPGWLVVVGLVAGYGANYVVNKDWRTDIVATRTSIIVNKLVHGQLEQLPIISPETDYYYGGYRQIGQPGIPSASASNSYYAEINTCTTALAKVVLGKTQLQNASPRQSVEISNGCKTKLGLELIEVYIPESEFWTLQDREGALVLGASALLWWGGWWWVRRTRA